MSTPHIYGKTLREADILAAIGESILNIKTADRLTHAEIGAVLRKSEDRVLPYIGGEADMGIVSYAFAEREWGSRFTGRLRTLIEKARGDQCPRSAQSDILGAALALSQALEDEVLTKGEIAANRATLETARDAIDNLLSKLKPEAA